jgi:hypothetical protein
VPRSSRQYSVVEVLFFRAIASLFTCAALLLPRTGLTGLHTTRLRDHLGRSATQAVAQSLIIIAFGLMPSPVRSRSIFLALVRDAGRHLVERESRTGACLRTDGRLHRCVIG